MENIQNNADPDRVGSPPILRVLVVDEDLVQRKLLSALVGQLGDEAMEAEHGLEGLDKAHRFRPHMIIAASRTTTLSGVELIREIRCADEIRPHILISIRPGEEMDLAAAIESGADDWIKKPVRQEIVLARLRIGRRILQLQADQARLSVKLQQYSEELTRLHGRIRKLALGRSDGTLQ